MLEHAEAATGIAVEHDFPVLLASTGQLRGWAMAALGDAAGGIAASTEGETAWRASGQRLGLPFFAVLRSQACLYADDRAGAEAAIASGLEHAHATGEHRQDSDLYRLRAECLRCSGRVDEAAEALDTALTIASPQGARLAKLRAAIACVRINQKNGRHQRAASLVRLTCLGRSGVNSLAPSFR